MYKTSATQIHKGDAFLIGIKMHVAKQITGVWLEGWGLFLFLLLPLTVWGTALSFRSLRGRQLHQLLGPEILRSSLHFLPFRVVSTSQIHGVLHSSQWQCLSGDGDGVARGTLEKHTVPKSTGTFASP